MNVSTTRFLPPSTSFISGQPTKVSQFYLSFFIAFYSQNIPSTIFQTTANGIVILEKLLAALKCYFIGITYVPQFRKKKSLINYYKE
jgi:hypothetical protein